jgi:glycosyltransferase involved in cell wall biosynthesis
MKSKLSVIILTYNRAESLAECLESLTKQTYKKFEVIIVDGDSKDKTPQIIEKYSKKLDIKKHIVRTPNIAELRDYGWRHAEGKFFSWIDDDVVVTPNWAEEVVKTFENNSNICGVSGPTLIDDKILNKRDVFKLVKGQGLIAKIWRNYFLEGKVNEPGLFLKNGWWTPGSNFKSATEIKGIKSVDNLEPCNMTYSRRIIERINGFDHSFYKDWSEADLAFRARKTGCKLFFNPKAVIYHNITQAGAYSGRTAAKERIIDFYRFYFRHIYKPKYIRRFLSMILFQNIYYTYKAVTDKNITWLGSWLGSLIGLKYLWQKNR